MQVNGIVYNFQPKPEETMSEELQEPNLQECRRRLWLFQQEATIKSLGPLDIPFYNAQLNAFLQKKVLYKQAQAYK